MRKLTYKNTLISISLMALLAIIFLPSIALAQTGSIGGRPVKTDPNNPRTKSIFIETLNPNQSASNAVDVINNTDKPKDIAVYAVDSVPSSDGAFACAQASDNPTGVGSWIKFDKRVVTVPANEDLAVPFTITAPPNAEPGEQNGCIVLQEVKEATFQGGIGLSFRTAIRVAVLVPGEIKKQLTPEGIAVTQSKENVIVSPSVRNTGNVSLDTTVTTSIKNFLGIKIASTESTFPVLRNQPTKWSFEFGKPFWGGLYRASYSLTYNASNDGVVGAQGSDADKKTVPGQSAWYFVVPSIWGLLIEIAILIALIALIGNFVRIKKHKHQVKTKWPTYKVQENDNIKDIAKRYNIPWKKLAKANKLKAPYDFRKGQVIKVPPETIKKKNQPIKQKKNRGV